MLAARAFIVLFVVLMIALPLWTIWKGRRR